jgi:hypothetical protein
MNPDGPDHVSRDRHAELEQSLIAEYLRGRGHTAASLQELPPEQKNALLKEACLYASGRLTEMESRAHYVDDMHHGGPQKT